MTRRKLNPFGMLPLKYYESPAFGAFQRSYRQLAEHIEAAVKKSHALARTWPQEIERRVMLLPHSLTSLPEVFYKFAEAVNIMVPIRTGRLRASFIHSFKAMVGRIQALWVGPTLFDVGVQVTFDAKIQWSYLMKYAFVVEHRRPYMALLMDTFVSSVVGELQTKYYRPRVVGAVDKFM